ncbi:MAG: PD40 domain-containing protein [Candidatus Latescibacteria bacterium]|nr:PD40 domain-containing protein [Candidatus Latescibacterota bacterium]
MLFCDSVRAQNHPELDWRVIETDHFKIYYHQGLEWVAGEAAEIAEAAYHPITDLYHFEPDDKVRIILKDTDDDFNGFAAYYDNKIEVLVTPMDYEYRGSRDWLRDVITHEFTHIVSLQVARKTPRKLQAFYLQYFGYQQEKDRKDILTGYPDVLTSYAIPTTVIPPWFAEGVAQYQASGTRHDHWDTHRDMILRVASLHDRLLPYDDLGLFEKTSLGNEMVYDHGYSLVRSIAERYGEDTLRELLKTMSGWYRTDFDGAIEDVLGMTGRDLYQHWKTDLRQRYEQQVVSIQNHRIEGERWSDGGFSNLSPIWSPDGTKLAYLSNGGRDNLSRSLVLMTVADRKEERVSGGVVSTLSWAPDGKTIVYTRWTSPNRYGSRYWDLYVYDLERRRERRLTNGLRVTYPDYSPDGGKIVFVKNQHGTNNLATLRADGSDFQQLTDFHDGTQIFTPRWSPDGKQIVCSLSQGWRRDIVLMPADGDSFQPLIASMEADERDPCWSKDGERIIFASDVTGIFNIYAYYLDRGTVRKLTDVLGGAFTPSLSPDGTRIAYSLYDADGYEIRVLPADTLNTPVENRVLVPSPPLLATAHPTREGGAMGQSSGLMVQEGEDKDRKSGRMGEGKQGGTEAANSQLSRTGSARQGTETSPILHNSQFAIRNSQPYQGEILNFSLMPRIAIDEGKPKLGLYAMSGDVVDRQSLLAGALVGGRHLDTDFFAIYEFKRLNPTLFLALYRQTRYVDERIEDRDNDVIIHNRTFALNEVDLGVTHKLWGHPISLALIYSRYNADNTVSAFNAAQRHIRGSISATYLNGFDFALTYHYRAIPRSRDAEIHPRGGREVIFRYDRQFNFFFKGFNQNSPILDEEYDRYFYNQLTLDWKEYLRLPARTALLLRLYCGFIDKNVDDFFDYRIGGITGMKGYTYYGLEGSRAMIGTAAFRFPILRRIGHRIPPLYFDKLYGSVYGDIGRVWDGASNRGEDDGSTQRGDSWKGFKKDVGAGLRLDTVSFYGIPTKFAFDAAYGLDERPGRQALKFYFALLFGYID